MGFLQDYKNYLVNSETGEKHEITNEGEHLENFILEEDKKKEDFQKEFDKAVEEIGTLVNQINEEQEDFIFMAIKPFCEEVAEFKITKEWLARAILHEKALENSTNGEVIKALFNVDTVDDFHNSYGIRINESNYFQLNKDWWNKPYNESEVE